eukprot:3940842-Rhodomonas_salina.1
MVRQKRTHSFTASTNNCTTRKSFASLVLRNLRNKGIQGTLVLRVLLVILLVIVLVLALQWYYWPGCGSRVFICTQLVTSSEFSVPSVRHWQPALVCVKASGPQSGPICLDRAI